MTYQLPEEISLQEVTLKVKDLDAMVSFYTSIIGLVLIKETEDTAFLGAQGSQLSLLILTKQSQLELKKAMAGLYHVAFLLPSRKDLGNSLLWLLQNKIEVGAGEHGYSEAIYLSDPEGNGIEIYRDRPRLEWDIRPSGEIIGVTEELDSEGVVAAADGKWLGLAPGSKIGHLHFQVSDLAETENFYQGLGFSLKANFGQQAKFFAAGNYHHHIGTNTWARSNLPRRTKNHLGLVSYLIELASREEFKAFEAHLNNLEMSYIQDEKGQLCLADPNGWGMKFTYKK